MIKQRLSVEIVSSTNNRLSSMGKKSRAALLVVLARHYSHARITIVNNLADLEILARRKPDLVFLGMKAVPVHPDLGWQDPDKIWVSQYLDAHSIAYTGSTQAAHELELNKFLAKQRVMDRGLKTAPYYVAQRGRSLHPRDIDLVFPLFVKPTNGGGGLGIDTKSVVQNFEQLQQKVMSIAANLGTESLVEEYLPGREFSVAILKKQPSGNFFVLPIEKIPPKDMHGRRVLTEKIKSADSVRDAAVTDPAIRAQVTGLALASFHALGGRDYGRIDIRLDAAGTAHFLEANLVPSLISGYGSFPKACHMNLGLDYETMILTIVKLALARRAATNEVFPVNFTTGAAQLAIA